MELDIIILPKSGNESQTQLELKQKLVRVLEKIYDDVQKEILQITINSEKVNVNYRISTKSDNMLFVKLWCKYTPAKEAEILDNAVNRLIRGEHRKDWNIVITYDEVSQLYCCKLMPLFGVFERRTRELVYTTIIKIFGINKIYIPFLFCIYTTSDYNRIYRIFFPCRFYFFSVFYYNFCCF